MKLLITSLLIAMFASAGAAEWNIEAGGGGDNGTPYFAPQYLTIQQGDVVNWNWVSGIHNVVCTEGPEFFSSGNHFSPFTFSYTFTLPGTYDFVCSYAEHEATQFGTITVSGQTVSISELQDEISVVLYPNPASDVISMVTDSEMNYALRIIDISGKQMTHKNDLRVKTVIIDCSDFQSGIYFAEIICDNVVVRRKFMVQ